MMFPDYQRVDNAAAQEKFRAAWGRELDDTAGPDGDRDRRQRAQGRRARDVHDGREPVPLGPERQQGPQGARRARVPRRAGHLPHRDGRVRRRRAARDVVPGEGRARTRTPTGACRSARKVLDPPGRGAAGLGDHLRRSPTGSGCRWSTARPREVFDEMVALSPAYAGLELRQPRAGRQALSRTPTRSTRTAPSCCSASRSRPTTARRTSCPPSGCRRRSCPTTEFPFVLNTGRLLEHWHTGSMTRRSFALDAIQPRAMVFIGHGDAARLGVAEGDFVRVTSAGAARSSWPRSSRTARRPAPASSRSTSARRRRTC